MDKKEIKQLIKNEIKPLLIGIRNDLNEYSDMLMHDGSEIAGVVVHVPNKGDKGKPGKDGLTPVKDKDYPSEKTVLDFIKDNLPKRGKDYFTGTDIKGIAKDVLSLIPKPKNGTNGVVDYTKVKDLATPLISAKYKELKSYVDKITNTLIEKIESSKQPEITAEKIRNKLEGLKGNARLDAKAIKGLEKLISGFFPTSTGGGGGQRVDLSGYVPYTGATSDVNLGTKNYLAGALNTPTGTSNIFLGLDDYWAINTVGNLHLQYLSSFGKWYCPTSTAVPPTYTAGDSVVVIISNVPTYLTLATVTPSVVSGPINGYILTFVEAYTPVNNHQMNKLADATHTLNAIASTNSVILGKYNTTVANNRNAFIAGTSNTDSMATSDAKLFTMGTFNTTKGGFTFGDSNSNTRSNTTYESNTVSIGNSNVFSGSGGSSGLFHVAIGGSNNMSGTASSMIVIGQTNTISGEAYVVGLNNTMSGTLGFALGRLNTVSGTFGSTVGNLLKSRAYAEVVLGHNSEDVTALSATSYNALDWALRLGGGTGNTSPATSKDIFRVRKNGEINNYLQTASAVGQVIKLFTSATGDAWQIQNVGGTVLTKFTATGNLEFNANNIITDTTTGTKIGTATSQKFGFWNKTPVIQQVTNAYTSDVESLAYTGIDNTQVGTVYATITDLNAIRTAYETLRTSYDDLIIKLKNTGIVA